MWRELVRPAILQARFANIPEFPGFRRGEYVKILMVVDYDKNVSAFEQVTLSGYVPAELKVAAYKFLAELMHVIPLEIKAHTRVETGHPGEIILAVAEEEASDLIIMGTRGLGAVHSLLAGSVSNHVVQYAKCPVLLCKGITNDFENVEI